MYRLVNKSQQYKDKLAAWTGKYVKGRESMVMPCVFEDRDPITIIRFLDQFQRSCDASGMSEEMEQWVLPSSKKEGQNASFRNLIVFIGDSRDAHAGSRAGDDKIGIYIKAGKHLLKSFATNGNVAKASSEISRLWKISIESAVQLQI